MNIQLMKKQITPILRRHGVTKAGIFGSMVTGEATEQSDIDLVLAFSEKKSLLDLVRLEDILEKKLHKKVDLLTYNGIHPLLKDIILKEQQIIYEKRS